MLEEMAADGPNLGLTKHLVDALHLLGQRLVRFGVPYGLTLGLR